MTIIDNHKSEAIEEARRAQVELSRKMSGIGDGKSFFADLLVITNENDEPVAIVRLERGLVDKQQVVIPMGTDGEIAEAVKYLLTEAQ